MSLRTLPRRNTMRLIGVIAMVGALVGTAATPVFAVVPANDDFADATALVGPAGSVSGSTAEATAEPGEPEPFGTPKSVWYRWTYGGESSQVVVFDTCNSSTTFDTTLAVFTGTSIGSLVMVAANDDSCGLQSSVAFEAVPGTTYSIQVAGFSGSAGTFGLNYPAGGISIGGAFVVTTTDDGNDGTCDSHCSLREAIVAANALAGADTITFDIAGAPPYSIQPLTQLPTITDPVVIDGTTQPGFSGSPIVELDGTLASIAGGDNGATGLDVTAGDSTVRGLAINRFTGPQKDGIRLRTVGGNVVEGNYLGTDVTGTIALGNVRGVTISFDSNNNRIGGTTPATRNVISGNTQIGIAVNGPSTNNVVEGNFIGTDAAGTVALGNGSDGISIFGSNNLVGGTSPGARNVISGNQFAEVSIWGTENVVEGNFIGTDVTGDVALGASQSRGLEIRGDNNVVGGTAPGARNVVSGDRDGVILRASSSANRIEGNFIGTTASGTAVIPVSGSSGRTGIWVDGAVNNVIGGTATGAGNVIAGHQQTGVQVDGAASGNAIQGNLIGTDATGTVDLGNAIGVSFGELATLNTIGGMSSTARNVISGNGVGVFAGPSSANTIQGNFIGVDVSGTAPLANSGQGVRLATDAFDYVIGGLGSGAGNVIAFNGTQGVWVASGDGNAILGNSIHTNGLLGIDLGLSPVTTNDPGDADSGPNNLQNFPVLTGFSSSGDTTTVAGTLNSTPNTTFRVEFFSNPTCDPSGFGEGKVFLGSDAVATDGAGDASFAATVPTGTSPDDVVTATATDPDGNTSEFSGCVVVGAANSPPTVTLSGPAATDEGQTETYTYTATDPDADPLTFTESCGDNGVHIATTAPNSFDCTFPDGPSTSIVEVTADDGEFGDSDSIEVTISNVTPVITSISAPADPVAINTQVNATAAFTDPGTNDTHSCTIDWGDGTGPVGGTVSGSECGGSHSYAAAGVYTLVVTVTDDDGDSDSEIFEYVVVYDPDGGFVTGGGWITSPAGAYTPDPSLTGKASFGFVSKYKKGTSVPDGNTQFQFHAAGMNFHSTDYQWLVIAGANAKYKGSGTIDGAGDYGFMLTATDGQRAGGGDIDRFRIKIWDKADGTVLYDNQIGDSDDAAATDAIEGGSIVIHTKK